MCLKTYFSFSKFDHFKISMLKQVIRSPALYSQELRIICGGGSARYSSSLLQGVSKPKFQSAESGFSRFACTKSTNISNSVVMKGTGVDYGCVEESSRASSGLTKDDTGAIKLEFITSNDVESWKAGLSEMERNWIHSSGSFGQEGDVVTMPTEIGTVGKVTCIVENAGDLWSYAALPNKLPPGKYCVGKLCESNDAGLSPENAIVLGWMLGTYSFKRYKSKQNGNEEEHGKAQLVWPSNCDESTMTALVEGIFIARDMVTTPAEDMGTY